MNQSTAYRERRRSKRVALASTLRYQFKRELGGHAILQNVDHHGLSVTLSQPLVKGQRIMLEVDEPKHGEAVIEMKGLIVWCHEAGGVYRAGIRVYDDESDVRVALCALMCAALKKQAAIASLRDRHFIYAEWKLAALAASEEPGMVWKKRERLNGAMRNALALGY